MRWIDVAEAGVQVLDPRRPPLDVNIPEVDATAGSEALCPYLWDDDGDRVVDDRIQPQMVRARTRLVKLRPRRGIEAGVGCLRRSVRGLRPGRG